MSDERNDTRKRPWAADDKDIADLGAERADFYAWFRWTSEQPGGRDMLVRMGSAYERTLYSIMCRLADGGEQRK